MRSITPELLASYHKYLIEEEKSAATIRKYLHDVEALARRLSRGELDKSEVLSYKSYLLDHYAVSSVNSMLSSLNHFFAYAEWTDLRVKTVKVQRRIFSSEERELSKAEYVRLLTAATSRGNERLCLLMQTVCSTGIRISELMYITVQAVRAGHAEICCKGKRRRVFLPNDLCRLLGKYIRKKKIKSGPVFVTKNGNPLDRSNIWSDMKGLCEEARVPATKVFPHNLRHLFARTYYGLQRDIVRLADILGHSSINTTRIYTQENGEIHRKQIQHLGLLRC